MYIKLSFRLAYIYRKGLFLVTCLFTGMCFQFNSDGRHKMDVAGPRNGLHLVMNADVDSYFIGPNAITSGFDVSAKFNHCK